MKSILPSTLKLPLNYPHEGYPHYPHPLYIGVRVRVKAMAKVKAKVKANGCQMADQLNPSKALTPKSPCRPAPSAQAFDGCHTQCQRQPVPCQDAPPPGPLPRQQGPGPETRDCASAVTERAYEAFKRNAGCFRRWVRPGCLPPPPTSSNRFRFVTDNGSTHNRNQSL